MSICCSCLLGQAPHGLHGGLHGVCEVVEVYKKGCDRRVISDLNKGVLGDLGHRADAFKH
eukprot:1160366-Pelagomonas_calceolata.AAC.7